MIPRPRTPQDATPPEPRTAVGAKGAARKGVRKAVGSDPHMGDGRRPTRWLHIVAPPSYSATPSAHSWCACGYDRTAIGRAGVLALIEAHTEHRTHCSLLATMEGSKAA